LSRQKRNLDECGIDWSRDDFIIRDVTPGPIAIYLNVDGQVVIVQGDRFVNVGRRDVGELIRQLRRFAHQEMGLEDLPQPSPQRNPPRVIPFPA
jgi:hypothetical protein